MSGARMRIVGRKISTGSEEEMWSGVEKGVCE